MFGSDMMGFPESREAFVRQSNNVDWGHSAGNCLYVDGLSLQRDTSYDVEFSFCTTGACVCIVAFNADVTASRYGYQQITGSAGSITGARASGERLIAQVGGISVVHGNISVRRDSDGVVRYISHVTHGAQAAIVQHHASGQYVFTGIPPGIDLTGIGVYAAIANGIRMNVPGYLRVYRRASQFSGGGANN